MTGGEGGGVFILFAPSWFKPLDPWAWRCAARSMTDLGLLFCQSCARSVCRLGRVWERQVLRMCRSTQMRDAEQLANGLAKMRPETHKLRPGSLPTGGDARSRRVGPRPCSTAATLTAELGSGVWLDSGSTEGGWVVGDATVSARTWMDTYGMGGLVVTWWNA